MLNEDALTDVESRDDLTPEARTVLEHERTDLDHLVDRLTGRGDGLRTSKPTAQNDSGLEQYVWRMSRFHSGSDPSIPVTATWWLDEWLDEKGIDAEVSGITDEAGEEITALLDVLARLVLVEMGYDPDGGIRRWEKALYGSASA